MWLGYACYACSNVTITIVYLKSCRSSPCAETLCGIFGDHLWPCADLVRDLVQAQGLEAPFVACVAKMCCKLQAKTKFWPYNVIRVACGACATHVFSSAGVWILAIMQQNGLISSSYAVPVTCILSICIAISSHIYERRCTYRYAHAFTYDVQYYRHEHIVPYCTIFGLLGRARPWPTDCSRQYSLLLDYPAQRYV